MVFIFEILETTFTLTYFIKMLAILIVLFYVIQLYSAY